RRSNADLDAHDYYHSVHVLGLVLFLFELVRRPPRSTLFPTRRSSDLACSRATARSRTSGRCRRCSASSARANGWSSFISRTRTRDRKSTRLNSSHVAISYAVFCLKKKKTKARTAARHARRKVTVRDDD